MIIELSDLPNTDVTVGEICLSGRRYGAIVVNGVPRVAEKIQDRWVLCDLKSPDLAEPMLLLACHMRLKLIRMQDLLDQTALLPVDMDLIHEARVLKQALIVREVKS